MTADVRLIAATNRDLKKEMEEGNFREDLYFRLNVLSIELPELKDRQGDVRILAEHFLGEMAQGLRLSEGAVEVLSRYRWPGNVRELRNVMERMSILAEGEELTVEDIPGDVLEQVEAQGVQPGGEATEGGDGEGEEGERPPPLALLERRHIESVLEYTGGNKARAARILGITAATLYNKLKAYKAADAETKDG